MTTTDKLVAEVRRLDAKMTVGPFRWVVNRRHKTVHLEGGRPRFDAYVMDFTRWGMSGATPRVRNDENLMTPVVEFAVPILGREHHQDWCAAIDHPDLVGLAEMRTAAPALAKAVERRDEVIHELAAQIENLYAGETSRQAGVRALNDMGLELVGGKWRIRET